MMKVVSDYECLKISRCDAVTLILEDELLDDRQKFGLITGIRASDELIVRDKLIDKQIDSL